tara:strand:+ start:1869 stop:2156 length:288 start_codon:yes stop_codon:yes gene_type:complete
LVEGYLVVCCAILIAISAVGLFRISFGDSVYDRLLAAGLVGTNTIVLLAMIGFIFNRPDMFIDLALAYALLNFIGTSAIAKYLERDAEKASRKWK